MKSKILLIITVTIGLLIFSAQTSSAQIRMAIAGQAYIVSDNNKDFGLEVAGKLVVPKEYKSFGSKDGKFFVVEAHDGKMGVCDDKGTMLFPCKYNKTAVSGSYITIYEEAGKPKFYKKDNPTVEVQPKEMSQATLQEEVDKKAPAGTVINVTATAHRKAEELAKQMSAEAPYGAYELRTNSQNKQELLVDGKVMFTANEFRLISDAAIYNRTTCWFFIVVNNNGVRNSYGLFIVAMGQKDGQKIIEDLLAIPFDYSFIEQYEAMVVKCTTWSGASKYFTWYGEPFDITKKGGK